MTKKLSERIAIDDDGDVLMLDGCRISGVMLSMFTTPSSPGEWLRVESADSDRITIRTAQQGEMVAPQVIDEKQWVRIDYTNFRGERTSRIIQPARIDFGATPYHPEPQWLLAALDVRREVSRAFAIRDIHSWRPAR